jgi:hypothetical protein
VNDRAVLGDHSVHNVQVTGDASQFVEDTASNQQHDDSSCAGSGDRLAHRWVQSVTAGDGAVIVQRDDRQLHSELPT